MLNLIKHFKKATHIFLILLSIFLLTNQSLANNIQTINSLSNSSGEAFGSKTHKEYLNSFIEYPISKKTSFGANSQLVRAESNHSPDKTAYALNSLEFFNRYKILSYKKIGVTIHNSYKSKIFNIYNENKYFALMPKQDDYEVRLLIGYNLSDRLVNVIVKNDTPYFLRSEIAYRHKFSNPFSQVKFVFSGGLKINEEFSLFLQNNIDWNVRSKATQHDNSYSNLSNFSMSKNATNTLNTSIIYHSSKDMAWQFGYFKLLSGNNPFVDNHGFMIGLWNSF